MPIPPKSDSCHIMKRLILAVIGQLHVTIGDQARVVFLCLYLSRRPTWVQVKSCSLLCVHVYLHCQQVILMKDDVFFPVAL